jgi:hypothetical protein
LAVATIHTAIQTTESNKFPARNQLFSGPPQMQQIQGLP